MTFQEQQRKKYLKQLVSTARAIISNHIGLPLGVLKMNNYLTWINDIEPLENIDVEIFSAYYARMNNLPVGTERLQWNIEKLIVFEEEIDQINIQFKSNLLRKCREIIDKFGVQITHHPD